MSKPVLLESGLVVDGSGGTSWPGGVLLSEIAETSDSYSGRCVCMALR